MESLIIAPDGEVKLEYEVVGRIQWADRVAHLRVAGDWFNGPEDVCWECWGRLAPAYHVEELEGELGEAREQIEKLKAEIKRLKSKLQP